MSNAALPKCSEATGSHASSKKPGDEAAAAAAAAQEQHYIKELNHRRTQLQLGLPGSPDELDEVAESAGEVKQQQPQQPPSPQPDCVEKHVVEDPAANQARAPVGWPPVQSFRKNSLSGPQGVKESATNGSTSTCHQQQQQQQQQQVPSLFVKVYMDGVPIGRKVNLRTHGSYDKLSTALEEMFRRFITGQAAAAANGSTKDYKLLLTECKKFNFIYGSDYVLTYEDKDGDLMLVGDVPWELFVGNVKRLRIMKGSEAIGLAPRGGAENELAAAAAPAAVAAPAGAK